MSKRRQRVSTPAPRRDNAPPPSRRRGALGWIGGAAALAAAAALAVWLWPGREPRLVVTRTADQNVLLITIDTLRADALGCYGGRAATPNLDRLAAEGLRYNFAHAQVPLTLPSHVSIMSGLYPFQHGVRDNAGYRVRPDTTTLATILEPKGWTTGAFVGAFPVAAQFGLNRGFGVYDDRFGETHGSSEFLMAERPADVVVDHAMKWLDAQHSRWFLWVHVYDPHAPYNPPEPYRTEYASDPYAGEVAFTDHALGPLVDRARAESDRPTLVVVTGDHGEALGDHGEVTHGLFAYEATLRVPLIIAQVEAGRSRSRAGVSEMPVEHVDLLPTILDALGLTTPEGLPGRSLLTLSPSDASDRASYFEALATSLNRGWAPLHGVLVGRIKYIDLPIPELYDLTRDPTESHNLVDRDPERTRVLEARLKAFGATDVGVRQAEDPETLARLRALGYTSASPEPGKKTYTEDDDPKRLIDVDRAVHEGITLFGQGRLDAAEAVYRRIIAKRPDMSLAYQYLAFIEWEHGQTGDAIATLRTAIDKAGPNPDVEAKLGIYLSQTGAIDEALPLLQHAVSLPGSDLDTLNALGIAYARKGREEDALATFRKILAVDPEDAMALQNMGSVHLAAGQLQAARDAFRRALAANPNWASAYTGLGVVELQTGHREQALEAWKKAVVLDPKDFDALFNLATELVNARRMDEARPYLQRFVETAPPAFYGKDIVRLRVLLQGGG